MKMTFMAVDLGFNCRPAHAAWCWRTTKGRMWTVVFALLVLIAAKSRGGTDPSLLAYTSHLPFAMGEVEIPNIPSKQISIAEFGAIGDGTTDNSSAFSAAIRRCAENGGGVVEVPPGLWMTGPIRLESRTELRLDSGAVVIFSRRFEDYPMFARPKSGVKCMPMIYGSSLTDVAITGKGMFDGNGQYWRPVKKEKTTEKQWKQLLASGGAVSPDGKIWWPSKEAMNGQEFIKELRKTAKKPSPALYAGAREFLRPVMLALDDCRRVLLDGPTFANAPGWTLAPTRCEEVVIRNVTVNNPWWGQNTDGLDINSCRDLVLYNSVLSDGDDGICIKPGKPGDGHPGEPACENIVVANCTVYSAHGGFVIGSESYGGARNISVRNCTFVGTDIGLRFKSAKDRGGVIEKVYVDGIRMKDIANEAILFDMSYDNSLETEAGSDLLPQYRDFHIENVACDGASDALVIRGLPEMPVKDIHLKNLSITAARACTIEDAEQIEVVGMRVTMQSGPVWSITNSNSITLRGIVVPSNAEVYAKVSGSKSGQIVVDRRDYPAAGRGIELLDGAAASSVVVDSTTATEPGRSGGVR